MPFAYMKGISLFPEPNQTHSLTASSPILSIDKHSSRCAVSKILDFLDRPFDLLLNATDAKR